MSAQTKQTRYGQLAHVAKGNGWELDPTATLRLALGDEVQNPYVWLHDAPDGGQWRVEFDFQVRGGNSWSVTYGDRLHGLTVTYVDERGNKQHPLGEQRYDFDRELSLARPSKYSSEELCALWLVTGRDANGELFTKDGRGRTLTERVKVFLADPALALWLTAERREHLRVWQEQLDAERKADAAERAKPLPIMVDSNEWFRLKYAALRAARAVADADGKSDLPALVNALVAATEDVAKVAAW